MLRLKNCVVRTFYFHWMWSLTVSSISVEDLPRTVISISNDILTELCFRRVGNFRDELRAIFKMPRAGFLMHLRTSTINSLNSIMLFSIHTGFLTVWDDHLVVGPSTDPYYSLTGIAVVMFAFRRQCMSTRCCAASMFDRIFVPRIAECSISRRFRWLSSKQRCCLRTTSPPKRW